MLMPPVVGYGYFLESPNAMTEFIIDKRSDAQKTDVNLLSSHSKHWQIVTVMTVIPVLFNFNTTVVNILYLILCFCYGIGLYFELST